MKKDLQTAMKEAMKAKDKGRLDTIRSLLAAIQYEEMEKKVDDLSSDAALAILQRELKKRREEVEFADKAARPDLKEKLSVEIATIESFLPQQLSAADLEKIITQLKTEQAGLNMGSAMKVLKEKYPGQYDGKQASEVAKKIFG
ncbi:MAG: GatB/YqeY domain-containing protein [Deltaproteobacteria bacterium]|nr:GatB/YqeY domain-containing protein [Deltaproteobacteria bacterium]